MSTLIGQTLLNQFRVDAFIASGGMGAVYRVLDTRRNVTLAMKVLHAELADDPHIMQRFQREARALKKLAHPNIVPFYGLYQADDLVFLLEYFVDGPTLKDALRQVKGALTLPDALAYMKPICAALGFAHASGVVHCDVKPGNVMIDANGQVYLTDFGIARHAESVVTTFGAAGTPGYMAPEQIRGEILSPATDVYALVVILFEMLTGRRPFRGDEQATTQGGATSAERIRYGHLNVPPPHPREINAAIPAEVEAVILKALEKAPENRHQDAGAFFDALLRAAGVSIEQVQTTVQAGGVPANPVSAADGRLLVPPKRAALPPVLWIMGGAVLFFCVACVVGVWLFRLGLAATPPPYHPPVAASTETTVRPANPVEPSATLQSVNPPATRRPLQPTFTPDLGPIYYPLSGCAPSRLRVGDTAYVYGKDRLFVRSSEDTHPADNITGYIYLGDLVDVIGGPRCSYGWIMWKISPPSGPDGWTVENNGTDFFLLPKKEQAGGSCSGILKTRLQVGGQAQVSRNGVPNALRKGTGTGFTKIGKLEPGSIMELLKGPVCADGYAWWKIRTSSGATGWTAESDSASYFLNPYP